MQGSPQNSRPPTPFNIAGPSKPSLNNGFVTAVDPDQFVVTAGTLHLKTGPTITVVGATAPLVINAGSAVPAGLATAANVEIIGKDGTINNMDFRAFGNANRFTGARADGTQAAPTALLTNEAMFQISGMGYNGTIYTPSVDFLMAATENWTGSTRGSRFQVRTTGTSGGSMAARFHVGNVVVVNSSGFSAEVTGGGALQVVNGALVDTLNIGVAAGVPNITSGAGVPAATQPSGSVFMRNDGSVGAHMYISNGGGTWTAVAGV